jgi:hypothetical protein
MGALRSVVVNKTFTHTLPINIPSTIGSNLAYIGFTGASGGESSSQKILSWTLTSLSRSITQTPVFSLAGGTFTAAQKVTLSDGTAGAVIYYTIDGSVPTTSSTVYGSPISVDSGTVTIKARPGARFQCQQRGRRDPHHPTSDSGNAHLFSGHGHLYVSAVGHHLRYNSRSDDLLHHRRHYPNHFVGGL